MIKELTRPDTDLQLLHGIVELFFKEIENVNSFEEIPFPQWFIDIFNKTKLLSKFKSVFKEFKNISFNGIQKNIGICCEINNEIQALCSKVPCKTFIEKKDLERHLVPYSEKLVDCIEDLFDTLYSNYLEYHEFENFTKTSVKKFIDSFNGTNKIAICPFCGIEGITRIKGQQRTALDHWLCKSKFPFSAVNFNNLVPMGDKCNGTRVKGDQNILLSKDKKRIQALYPYMSHSAIEIKFQFIKEPIHIDDLDVDNCKLTIKANDINDQPYFNHWMELFNIEERFYGFLDNHVLINWESSYVDHVEENKNLNYANSINEFKENLSSFKSCFPKFKRDGALIYRAFLDGLMNASDKSLNAIYKNLRDE